MQGQVLGVAGAVGAVEGEDEVGYQGVEGQGDEAGKEKALGWALAGGLVVIWEGGQGE